MTSFSKMYWYESFKFFFKNPFPTLDKKRKIILYVYWTYCYYYYTFSGEIHYYSMRAFCSDEYPCNYLFHAGMAPQKIRFFFAVVVADTVCQNGREEKRETDQKNVYKNIEKHSRCLVLRQWCNAVSYICTPNYHFDALCYAVEHGRVTR